MGPKVLRQWGPRCTQGRQPVHVLRVLQIWEAHAMQKNKGVQTPLTRDTRAVQYTLGPMHRPQNMILYPSHVTLLYCTHHNTVLYGHGNVTVIHYRDARLATRRPSRNRSSVLSMRSVPTRHILSLYTSTRPKADVPGGHSSTCTETHNTVLCGS